MNNIELNAILFYADYLSLKATSTPVTDNCKYFFVFGCPVNAAFIVDNEPIFDPENEYLLEAYQQYKLIQSEYQEDGVMSFINDICFLRACGMVDAERMLLQIHMFSTKQERKQAFNEYRDWKKTKFYTHQVIDENGKPQQVPCTTYFKHAEISLKRRGIPQSLCVDGEDREKRTC